MPVVAKKNKRKTVNRTVKKKTSKIPSVKVNVSASYNRYKEYQGKQYSGMKIGGSHKWYYDKGEWRDRKITPDLWEISYAVTKRRAGYAPKGSGAAVGTAYHWYIVAHQNVKKLNADDYSTALSGFKFKVAHKRAAKGKWNMSTATQRKHLVQFFKEMIAQLEEEAIPLKIEYQGNELKGEAVPVKASCEDGICFQFEINLNDEYRGIVRKLKSGWKMDGENDQAFIDLIGDEIMLWYE